MKTNKITVSLEGIDMPYDNNQLNEDDSGNESKSKRAISAYENNVSKKGKNSKVNNNLTQNQLSMLNKKKKQRRSRLIMSEESDSIPEHRKEIYEGEAKIEKSLESASLFNNYINTKRSQLAKHFLKRKIKQNFEREDKHPVFFNVKFLPKQEMFAQSQIVPTNSQMQQQQRVNKQVPYQQGRPMMNPGAKPPISQQSQNPPRPTYQNPPQQIPPGGINPANSKLFNVNNNSNIQNKQQSGYNEANKGGITQISINTQNANPNNAHHYQPHRQTTPLDAQKKEEVIKKITDKYNSDKEQLKRNLGEDEFRRIEAYLWKKGKIPNPSLNKNNSYPASTTPSEPINPSSVVNNSDLTYTISIQTNTSK